jgi:hypothetical protein
MMHQSFPKDLSVWAYRFRLSKIGTAPPLALAGHPIRAGICHDRPDEPAPLCPTPPSTQTFVFLALSALAAVVLGEPLSLKLLCGVALMVIGAILTLGA